MSDIRAIKERARELLPEHGVQMDDGRWCFKDSFGYPRTEQSMLAAIEACLLLDVPITDQIKAETWRALVGRVVDLEQRLARIEATE